MASDLLGVLVRLCAVGTLGIILVGALRAVTRRAVGSEAAYWLWLFVPASLIAVLLPQPPACLCRPDTLLSPLLARGLVAPFELASSIPVQSCALSITISWGIGVATAVLFCAYRQWMLERLLRPLHLRTDGAHCSSAAKQPMLLGVWGGKIVLPINFEIRYSEVERNLILAHEGAHIARKDPLTNLIACGLVCLFWFNPLVYCAWRTFRFDQEVACDAAVLRQTGASRGGYARALANTHLVSRMTIAFGAWRRHPLLERIALLKQPAPTPGRRVLGYAFSVVFMLTGAYVVWTARPHDNQGAHWAQYVNHADALILHVSDEYPLADGPYDGRTSRQATSQ
jgi:bla regulator protein blaR1